MKIFNFILLRILLAISMIFIGLLFFICCNDTKKEKLPFTFTQELNANFWVEQNPDTNLDKWIYLNDGDIVYSRTFKIENQSPVGFLQYKIETDHKIWYTQIVDLSGYIEPQTAKNFSIKDFGYIFLLPYDYVNFTIQYGPELESVIDFTLKK